MSTVFVSYGRDELGIELSRLVYDRLNAEYLLPWRDQEDIKPGKEWRQSIDEMIHSCICMIVVISERALESQNVCYEWSGVNHLDKRIIPVRFLNKGIKVKENHPILRFQFMDFDDENHEDKWDALFTEIREIRETISMDPHIERAALQLYSTSKERRQEAQNYLVNYQSPEAANALAEAVRSDSIDVAMGAAFALHRKDKNDPRAIPGLKLTVLEEVYNAKWDNMALAAMALAEIEDSKARDALKELANNQDVKIRFMAINHGIASMRYPEAYEVIRDTLRELSSSEIADQSAEEDSVSKLVKRVADDFIELAHVDVEFYAGIVRKAGKDRGLRITILDLVLSLVEDTGYKSEFLVDEMAKVIQEYYGNMHSGNENIVSVAVKILSEQGELGTEKLRHLKNNPIVFNAIRDHLRNLLN